MAPRAHIVRLVSALVGAALVLAAALPAPASEFCRGFERGYVVGYKRVNGQGLDPPPPVCPMQPMRLLGETQNDFEHGFAVGMDHGIEAASARRR
jgi:hypothetical protein